jgi:hypothetical protein
VRADECGVWALHAGVKGSRRATASSSVCVCVLVATLQKQPGGVLIRPTCASNPHCCSRPDDRAVPHASVRRKFLRLAQPKKVVGRDAL